MKCTANLLYNVQNTRTVDRYNMALGFFAVGLFAVGQFTVKKKPNPT